MTETLLTAKQVAGIIGCSVDLVRKLYHSGALRGMQINVSMFKKHVRFAASDVREFLSATRGENSRSV